MIIEDYNSKDFILIAGARLHNLKNVNVAIPRNAFTVITGVSGSGKSSLAFDTLYAEGQRRYVESLSSYARQFLARLEKPEVDYIKGISPTVAIEQKVVTNNPRSTVATSTEIYELLKLLFARVGRIIDPRTEREVKSDEVEDVVNEILKYQGEKGAVVLPYEYIKDYSAEDLIAQGFSRGSVNGSFVNLSDIIENQVFDLVIERFVVKNSEDFIAQLSDSIELAFSFADGNCEVVFYFKDGKTKTIPFTKSLTKDGITFLQPDLNLFNFNSPIGACEVCEGFGKVLGISEDLVIPDKNLSIFNKAVAPWRTDAMKKWQDGLIKNAHHFDFPVHQPYNKLTKSEKELLWKGNEFFDGINDFFNYLQKKLYKIQNRVLISRYKGRTDCNSCGGSRLKKEALYVKVAGLSIGEINEMTIREASAFFNSVEFDERDKAISERIIKELNQRLDFLLKVGVPYITLNRPSNTLSGGESQRINLASSLGNNLVGATYVLDEPSIGLHPRDTQNLIKVLRLLNEAGNTVVVVEHDEDIIKSAGYVIDIGPNAGRLGGEVTFMGAQSKLLSSGSLTAQYLTGALKVDRNKKSNFENKHYIELINSYKNNLKIDKVKFPLYSFNVICGVSGSGKSTLILDELVPEIKLIIDGHSSDKLSGMVNHIEALEYVNQNPIGRSSRSNPATYVKAFDDIRQLFFTQPLSKNRGYKAGHFSLNVTGGRCEKCAGEGEITVEMQFMADMKVKCEECEGKKFKSEVLEVLYKDRSINDILNLTIDEAIEFFENKGSSSKSANTTLVNKILSKLIPLQKVGLGYVKLGQSSNTLSGGEAQRVKLAFYLIKGNANKKTLFVFDEPTTGLHFHDVNLLLQSFNELLLNEHHLIVIEHNMDVIKQADYIIEVGPGGGDEGGELIYFGEPSKMKKSSTSVTKNYID